MLERRDAHEVTFWVSFPLKAFPDAEKRQIPKLKRQAQSRGQKAQTLIRNFSGLLSLGSSNLNKPEGARSWRNGKGTEVSRTITCATWHSCGSFCAYRDLRGWVHHGIPFAGGRGVGTILHTAPHPLEGQHCPCGRVYGLSRKSWLCSSSRR